MTPVRGGSLPVTLYPHKYSMVDSAKSYHSPLPVQALNLIIVLMCTSEADGTGYVVLLQAKVVQRVTSSCGQALSRWWCFVFRNSVWVGCQGVSDQIVWTYCNPQMCGGYYQAHTVCDQTRVGCLHFLNIHFPPFIVIAKSVFCCIVASKLEYSISLPLELILLKILMI